MKGEDVQMLKQGDAVNIMGRDGEWVVWFMDDAGEVLVKKIGTGEQLLVPRSEIIQQPKVHKLILHKDDPDLCRNLEQLTFNRKYKIEIKGLKVDFFAGCDYYQETSGYLNNQHYWDIFRALSKGSPVEISFEVE